MILPFQKYIFVSGFSVPELHRRLMLMFEQRIGFSENYNAKRRIGKQHTPVFSGLVEKDRFLLVSHKQGGEEDLAQIKGVITRKGILNELEVELRFTTSWLTELAAGLVLALVAAYMYGFIGMKLLIMENATPLASYFVLVMASLWINLRRYGRRAEALLEQLVNWLELKEEPEN